MSSVVSTKGLRRSFGKTVALESLDLELEPGRVIGLVGDNGAGKSTTLRLLLGLLKPDAGKVEVCGLDPQRQGVSVRTLVGYIPEDRRLYPTLRLERLLAYAAGLNPRWDAERCAELMARLELDPKARVRSLSRGALARLHFVLTLSARPRLLLLDEATGGIDALTRRHLLGHLVELVETEETTVIFASHVLEDVARVAEEVVMLRRGALAVHAPLDELMQRYAHVVVSFPGVAPDPPAAADLNALSVERRRHEWSVLTQDPEGLGEIGDHRRVQAVSFEDLFIGFMGAA